MNTDVYGKPMDHCRRGIIGYMLGRITLYLVVMGRYACLLPAEVSFP